MHVSFRKKIAIAGAALLSTFGILRARRRANTKEPASTPIDLSFMSWKKSIIETGKAIGDKNIGILSAGIAYFGILAFFPMVAAMVAIAGTVLPPDSIREAATEIKDFLPGDIYSLLVTQLENASGQTSSNIAIAVFGISFAIFSVSGATTHLMNSLNVMYGIKEGRNFVKQRLVGVLFTIGLIVTMVIVVPLLLTGADVLRWFGFPPAVTSTFAVLRWFLLAILTMVGLAILYHFGPSRPARAKWQWVSWGAIIATLIWIAGSALFFIYLQYFANFSNSYSLFAGLIALMIWLNLSSFVVLLGAEINHRLEQRTAPRTTK